MLSIHAQFGDILADWFIFDPAIGFNVETVQYNNIKFQVWDLGNAWFT